MVHRVFPIVKPDWQRLYTYAGLQKYIKSQVGHVKLGFQKRLMVSTQKYRDIGVAVSMVRLPGSATKEHSASRVVARRHLCHKKAGCRQGLGVQHGVVVHCCLLFPFQR